MVSRNFLRPVHSRANGENSAHRPPDPAATAEDALLILVDIIEDMLDEASAGRRPVPNADRAT